MQQRIITTTTPYAVILYCISDNSSLFTSVTFLGLSYCLCNILEKSM